MHQTSLQAYNCVKKQLANRQAEVLGTMIKMGGRATMHGVATIMGVQLHTISGRFGELRKNGWIREAEVYEPEGKQPRTVWEVVK